LRSFGKHLFGRFVCNYPQFFGGINSALTFLANIEGYIHVEVRKLYPDAELPSLTAPQSHGG
jgi:Haem-NO-binding